MHRKMHRGQQTLLCQFNVIMAVFLIVHFLLLMTCLVNPPPKGDLPFHFDSLVPNGLSEFLFDPEKVLGAVAFWTACAVLTRPSSRVLMLLFSLLTTAYVVASLPITPNHMVFVGILSLGIAVETLRSLLLRQDDEFAATEFCRNVLPVARAGLILLYGLAVLHKLNQDYFKPEVSCGLKLYDSIATSAGFLPPTSTVNAGVVIAGSLLLETGIPLLLLAARTRFAGIILGTAFHSLLALHPNYMIASFSVLVVLLYGLFLPQNSVRVCRVIWRRRLFHAVPHRLKSYIGALVAVAVVHIVWLADLIALTCDGWLDAFARRVVVGTALTSCFVVLAALASLYLMTRRPLEKHGFPTFFPRLGIPTLVLPLVVCNGLCPYLGLKTTTAFSMFSNIRTENGISNHLFVPAFTQIASYQRDLVTIRESSSPWLRALAQRRDRLVHFEFQRFLEGQSHAADFHVTYEHRGRVLRIDRRAGSHPETIEPIGAITGRFLHFRPVRIESEPCPCSW